MPTYSYACTECPHRFDTVQAFTDSSLTECPECTGRLRKLYGSVGVVFKGSGFYRTDSRAGSHEGKDGKDSGESKSEQTEKSGKSEKSADQSATSQSSNGTKSDKKSESSSGSSAGSGNSKS